MKPSDCIRVKRDGGELDESLIQAFVDGAVLGEWSEGQLSAMLMAIYLNGMTPEETARLTKAMMLSGEILSHKFRDGSVIDKHSTGGVGDKVSLILTPLAVACGLHVPMISGRGLGHTGGTLDKLESIPGFKIDLSTKQMLKQMDKIGCFMVGQTDKLVPADRMLYALRDVTSTVESRPLICASILSKKFAEGIDGLVMDVKCGRGAFMKTPEEAEHLANDLVSIGRAMKKPIDALITRMDHPIGRAIGNAVEVEESLEVLKGEGPDDLRNLTVSLVVQMLKLAKIPPSGGSLVEFVEEKLDGGDALVVMEKLIQAQGGNPKIIEDYDLLPRARFVEDIFYEESETVYVEDIETMRIARTVMDLGAGRKRSDEQIDHAVGLSHFVQIGERLEPGDLVARIHYTHSDQRDMIIDALQEGLKYNYSGQINNERVLKIIESDREG